jgi:hypothetical protein
MRARWILIGCLCLIAFQAGCATTAIDQHYAVMRGLANKVNAATFAELQDPNTLCSFALIVENEARAAGNISAANHWGSGTKQAAVTTRPSTLPWTPPEK